MIIELAVYEKAREQVLASVEDIEHSLFGPGACSEALICTVNGEPAGYAVFFMSYSTGWVKRHLSGRPVRGAEASRRGRR